MNRLGWLAALLSVLLAACHGAGRAASDPQKVAALTDRLEGKIWVEREGALAMTNGAGPLQIAATDVAADGDRVGGFVAIPSEQCLLAYARGSPGIDDLDLYAYGDDGSVLGADEAADPHPALIICPPHPTRAYVVARVAAGRGIVAVAVHSVSPAAAERAGRSLGARGRPGEEMGRVESWPGLDERVSEHRRLLGGHWEELRRVAVQADARAPTRLTATLSPDRCLDVLVVPGEEFAQLEVTLLGEDERILARAVPYGRDRSAIICSPVQSQIAIEVRPHAGQGLCAVVLGQSPRGAERQIGGPVRVYRTAPTIELSVERAQRAKILRALGYPDGVQVGTGTADVGRRTSFPVALPDGCVRLEIVAGRPLAGITADLWSANGDLIATGDAGEGPTLFACGKATAARIDIEAMSHPGPFAVELRKEKLSPPTLAAHPLAAGRLLSVVASRGDAVTAGAAADAKVLALDGVSLKTVEVQVPDGRCADVVAAVDAGGAGIDMRLFDPQANEESSLVRGRLVAESRVCATARNRSFRAELRLTSGKADALVWTRLLPPGASR
jgi:hypothetical protein